MTDYPRRRRFDFRDQRLRGQCPSGPAQWSLSTTWHCWSPPRRSSQLCLPDRTSVAMENRVAELLGANLMTIKKNAFCRGKE